MRTASSSGDGDSARCGASNFAGGTDSSGNGTRTCLRGLPRQTVYLRQLPALAVGEIPGRSVADLSLGTARGSCRLRTNCNTRQICVTSTAADANHCN